MMNEGKQRPVMTDARPRRVMFSYVGSTGWRRRRDLRGHKGNKKEGDFSHLHEKFWGEGDESV
jgi:hypothetical protein